MNKSERRDLSSVIKMTGDLLSEFLSLRLAVREKLRERELPEWLDLEQCVELKRGVKRAGSPGGAPLLHYRNKKHLQPCKGGNWKKIGGRRCWHKDDVTEWLKQTDADWENRDSENGAPPGGGPL